MPLQKVNPYYLPQSEGCGQADNCPYKTKSRLLTEADFRSDELVSFDDPYCQICKRELKAPPPPPSSPRPLWRKWMWVLALFVVGGLITYWMLRKDETTVSPLQKTAVVPVDTAQEPVVSPRWVVNGDTCVGGKKFERLTDGQGHYKLGDPTGTCKTPQTEKKDPLPFTGTRDECVDGTCYEVEYRGGTRIKIKRTDLINCTNCP